MPPVWAATYHWTACSRRRRAGVIRLHRADQIIPRLQGANIAIVNKTVIDAAVMAACLSLKMIAVTGALAPTTSIWKWPGSVASVCAP
ncbi:MAG: hypothetical protein R3F38_01020 [Gammaproteobacteria bacterium]